MEPWINKVLAQFIKDNDLKMSKEELLESIKSSNIKVNNMFDKEKELNRSRESLRKEGQQIQLECFIEFVKKADRYEPFQDLMIFAEWFKIKTIMKIQ